MSFAADITVTVEGIDKLVSKAENHQTSLLGLVYSACGGSNLTAIFKRESYHSSPPLRRGQVLPDLTISVEVCDSVRRSRHVELPASRLLRQFQTILEILPGDYTIVVVTDDPQNFECRQPRRMAA